jgi:hypothetical protein
MTDTSIVRQESTGGLALPAQESGIPIEALLARVEKIREAQRRAMKHGLHYGEIPGVSKPTLLKPGAELLGMLFQLAPQFKPEDRWDGEHLEVVVTCQLYHAPSQTLLGEGLGSCSTKESKYAWRKGERVCPSCGEPAIIKGKEDFGGGWICWNKPEKGKHGCGAKFKDGDESIELQTVDRVPNPDLADQYNTVRKMACKRAHIAATLFVTCASEIFTQDVEDMPDLADRAKPPAGRPQQGRQQQEKPIPQRGDKRSGELRDRLLGACDGAYDLDALSALDEELQSLKSERLLTIEDFQSLTKAFAGRHAQLQRGAA